MRCEVGEDASELRPARDVEQLVDLLDLPARRLGRDTVHRRDLGGRRSCRREASDVALRAREAERRMHDHRAGAVELDEIPRTASPAQPRPTQAKSVEDRARGLAAIEGADPRAQPASRIAASEPRFTGLAHEQDATVGRRQEIAGAFGLARTLGLTRRDERVGEGVGERRETARSARVNGGSPRRRSAPIHPACSPRW